MSQLFSTELLPVSDRIDAWQWNAQQICGDCRIQLPRSSFHGSIEVRQLGALRLTRFSSSPLSFWKCPADTVSAENRSCIVITQIAGARRYLQNGAEVLLKAGDSTVIDAGSSWSSSCPTDCVRLYLRVPRWMMENRLRTRKIPVVEKISGGSRIGAILCRLAQSLFEEAGRMGEQESVAGLDAYFRTLAACLGRGEIALERGPELARQILRYVEAHLAEPTLTPLEVASAVGISLRHLHRIFSSTGKTMGDYVRVRRLKQCREDMVDPRLQEKTITEIAFFWGFSDAAHFSHSFRKHYGVSPRAFRALAAGKGRLAPGDERLPDFYPHETLPMRVSSPN
jgi:AraC family transcriptional regulator, positive regulator of tynA and feaB